MLGARRAMSARRHLALMSRPELLWSAAGADR